MGYLLDGLLNRSTLPLNLIRILLFRLRRSIRADPPAPAIIDTFRCVIYAHRVMKVLIGFVCFKQHLSDGASAKDGIKANSVFEQVAIRVARVRRLRSAFLRAKSTSGNDKTESLLDGGNKHKIALLFSLHTSFFTNYVFTSRIRSIHTGGTTRRGEK